jgi:hypothetical protein
VRAIASLDGALPSEQSAATYVLGESHPGMYTVCVSGDYEKLIPASRRKAGLDVVKIDFGKYDKDN